MPACANAENYRGQGFKVSQCACTGGARRDAHRWKSTSGPPFWTTKTSTGCVRGAHMPAARATAIVTMLRTPSVRSVSPAYSAKSLSFANPAHQRSAQQGSAANNVACPRLAGRSHTPLHEHIRSMGSVRGAPSSGTLASSPAESRNSTAQLLRTCSRALDEPRISTPAGPS